MADRPLPEACDVIKYHRRLDRTPEKNFHKLPDADKILISQIRQAREESVLAVSKLKDDIEEREKTIDEERRLREKAEERLKSHLVDMYKSSDVNSELRERLPKANKKDILTTEMDGTRRKDGHPPAKKHKTVTDEMVNALADQFARLDNEDSKENHGTFDPSADERIRRNSANNLGSEYRRPFVPHERVSDIRRHSLSDASDLDTRRVPVGGRQAIPKPNLYHPYNHMLSTSTTIPPPPMYSHHLPVPGSMYGGPHPSNLPFNRYMSMSTPVLYPPHDQMIPSVPPTSLLHTDHPGHPSHHRGYSVPMEKNATQEKTTLSSSNESGFSSTEDSGQTHSVGFSPPENFHQASATSDLGTSAVGSRYGDIGGGQIRERGLYGGVPRSGLTYSSYIPSILSQLEAERDINNKLRERLTITECNLETVQINSQQKEAETRLAMTEKAAELVKEIHTAQKSREEYILDQVQPANQNGGERMQDTLYFDGSIYDRSESYFDHSTDSDDSDLDFKFHRVSSPNSVPKGSDLNGSHLLKQVDRMIRVKEIMQKQMQEVVIERDRAVAKWRKAEKELRQQRETLEGRKKEDKSLMYIQQERDAAVKKVHQLEETIHNTQLAYSLQKSLSPEVIHNTLIMSPRHNKSWQTPDTQHQTPDTRKQSLTWSDPGDQSPPLGKGDEGEGVTKMRTDPKDKNQLIGQLRRLMSERDDLQENNKRLERQVKVLQRKLNECYTSKTVKE